MESIIGEYVKRITVDDIISFGASNDCVVSIRDASIIMGYLKKDWQVFYKGNPSSILMELEVLLEANTFAKLKEVYIKYKNKFS